MKKKLISIKNKFLFQYYRFLWWCAKKYLKRHQAFSIWVNWSVWKTSCRMIIHQTLEKAFPNKKIYTSPKNFNWELGMSLSILMVENWNPTPSYLVWIWCKALWMALFWKKWYDCIVLEYWIDRPKEMEFLVSINKPHIWVFTAIDAVHSEQFWNPTEIAREEVKMVKNTREIAFLNADDIYAQQIVWTLWIDEFTYQTLWYDSKADIHFENENVTVSNENKHFVLSEFDIYIKKEKNHLKTNLLGKPNYWYICVALCIAEILSQRFTGKELDLKKLLKEPLIYKLQPWRCSIFKWKHDSILIDSTYNASPLSVRKLIDTTLSIQKASWNKKKILLVLWDMRELWDLTEKEHRLLAWYVQWSADHVVLLWNSMHNYLADEIQKIGFSKENLTLCHSYHEVWKRVDNFLKDSKDEWIVLIKWSQNTIFLEEATKALLKDKKDAELLTRQSAWRLKKKGVKI
jgi:UDP-N-acetylmuramyl pentapeptide synthase